MKMKLLFLIFIVSINTFAQIPNGYYSTATGTGYTLKTQLYNIIKGHTNQTYAGLWTTYATSDRDVFYENDNTVLDIYSENPSGIDPVNFVYGTNQCGVYTTQGNCYNREHIIPQSIFSSAQPMESDAHFIIPVDGYVNGMRSNHPHGTVATATWTSLNGSKVGASSIIGYTGTVFEPLNDFKGDIARMYFYFATRYENLVAGYTNYPMFDATSNHVFTTPFLNMLITWHNQDPVSAKEISRNNAIYLRQNNRNPFIDHPEYVGMIWSSTLDTVAPTTPTNLAASLITASSLTLTWTASTDNVSVTAYDVYMNGVLKTTVTTTTAAITGLSSGTNYSFYVVAKDAAGNVSANSASINATTVFIIDTTPPTPPSSITSSSLTGSSLTINWSNSSDYNGVTAYDVYLNGILSKTVTSTSATLTGLTSGTTYSIYLIARDAANNSSAPSVTVNLKTCSCS
jgi:endonuclease I/chitodextrinase